MAEIAINNQTAAATFEFSVDETDLPHVTVQSHGLGVGENVKIQHYVAGAYRDMYVNNALIELTTTNNRIPINVIGRYQIFKDVTAATTVEISRKDDL